MKLFTNSLSDEILTKSDQTDPLNYTILQPELSIFFENVRITSSARLQTNLRGGLDLGLS